MPTLSLTILKGRPNRDGGYAIKVAVAALGRTAYITTKYQVDDVKQWSRGRVVRHPNASALNRKLLCLLADYEQRLEELPRADAMTAVQLREFLVSDRRTLSMVKEFAAEYIARLTENGQVSYAQNMSYTARYLEECFGADMPLDGFTLAELRRWEKWLFDAGNSATTVNIRMTHLKALLNAAVNEGVVEYKVFPFRLYRLPSKKVRDICISREEFARLRDAVFTGTSERRLTVARDLFLLSFYCAGINLTDVLSADLSEEVLTFVRKKTADRKQGEKKVSITIQPEAREIIERYRCPETGDLDFGYRFRDYGQFRSFVTKSLNRIGVALGFEKSLMYYSARKTFCQFGHEIGVPLYVLEYAIGQTIKDAASRPIFDYIRVMRSQADAAIRSVIDYSLGRPG